MGLQIAQPNSPQDDDGELRRQALQLYCTLPVPRLVTIARQFKLDKDLINKWHAEDSWLAERARWQKQKLDELIQELADPKNTAKQTLDLTQKIRNLLDTQLTGYEKERRTDLAAIEKAQKVLTSVYELERKVFTDAGLAKE